MIALDRLEAPERALFDASREATLARRYETEAQRGFFRALNEFRLVEAEAIDRLEAAPTPELARPLASSRVGTSPAPRDPLPSFRDPLPDRDGVVLSPNVTASRLDQGASRPG
jgi:hypothetical protein